MHIFIIIPYDEDNILSNLYTHSLTNLLKIHNITFYYSNNQITETKYDLLIFVIDVITSHNISEKYGTFLSNKTVPKIALNVKEYTQEYEYILKQFNYVYNCEILFSVPERLLFTYRINNKNNIIPKVGFFDELDTNKDSNFIYIKINIEKLDQISECDYVICSEYIHIILCILLQVRFIYFNKVQNKDVTNFLEQNNIQYLNGNNIEKACLIQDLENIYEKYSKLSFKDFIWYNDYIINIYKLFNSTIDKMLLLKLSGFSVYFKNNLYIFDNKKFKNIKGIVKNCLDNFTIQNYDNLCKFNSQIFPELYNKNGINVYYLNKESKVDFEKDWIGFVNHIDIKFIFDLNLENCVGIYCNDKSLKSLFYNYLYLYDLELDIEFIDFTLDEILKSKIYRNI